MEHSIFHMLATTTSGLAEPTRAAPAAARPAAAPARASGAATADKALCIALVTPMLPVPHDQTRGRYIHETARSLAKVADVRVFFQQLRYPDLPGMKPRSYLHGGVGADYSAPGIDVEAFEYPGIPVLSRVLNGYVCSRALAPRVRAFNPDVVLAYWVYPDGYAALRVARALGVPCVVGALGSDIHVRSGMNQLMTRRTIAGADALLTVSEAMRRTAIDTFGAAPDRVHTVVNGFNTTVFGPADQTDARQSLGLGADDRIVVYVGRIVEAKGMRELVGAAQQLCRDDPRLRVVVIGDGVMKAELEALIQSSGMAGCIRLTGGLEPHQVAQWICAADLLTLPSWSEGYPNVVVEALACGRPVVATDVGGTREIVNPENGLLIPRKDVVALQAALRQALDRRWDHAAIAAAMQRSWDDVAKETLAVCEALVPASRRQARQPVFA